MLDPMTAAQKKKKKQGKNDNQKDLKGMIPTIEVPLSLACSASTVKIHEEVCRISSP